MSFYEKLMKNADFTFNLDVLAIQSSIILG